MGFEGIVLRKIFKILALGNGIFGQAGEFLGLISPAPALLNSDERVSGLEYEFR